LATPSASLSTPSIQVPSMTPRCPLPEGWSIILVNLGDTLSSLAEAYQTTEELLAEANCLKVPTLHAGTEFYVPYVYPTEIVAQCGPPSGWVFYTVKSGDTLFDLSRRLGVTVAKLQFANCLGSSTLIKAGQKLYVPFIPSTPVVPPTNTQAPSPSATAEGTATPTQLIPATSTSTRPPTQEPTYTTAPTRTPTEEPILTPTPTDVPTSTSTPTSIPTNTATSTQPATSTATSTSLPSPTSTETPVPPPPTNTVTPTLP
jgi:LysM repeat protein